MGQFRFRLTIQAGLCLVGCLQLVAFTSLLFQFPYLYGRHGVQPVSTIMEGVPQADAAPQLNPGGAGPVLSFPSLLWLHDSLGLTAEAMLAALCSAGWLLSAAAACGLLHPLVFTAVWLIYLSFKSLGGDFVEYGDEVLLEVSFAAIWLAVVHQANKQSAQQEQQHQQDEQQPPHAGQQLSTAVLLLPKWLLFRLLMVTSTFSAAYLCGQDPALHSCWKTLVAHGLPHAATRWLQTLPGPVRAAAAAVTLLELPVAFLVLVYAPFLQRITSTGLLILQLLRLAAGPASLANLAAAVLSFMLMDDDLWVPVLLRAAKAMRVGPVRSNVSTEQLQDHAGGSDVLTRQDSAYSEDAASEPPQQDELGPDIVVGKDSWAPILAAVALVPCAALLLSYNSSMGLILRPTPAQLFSTLQVAVPLAVLAFAASMGVACWQAITTSLSYSRAAATLAADAERAAAGAEEAAASAATPQRQVNGDIFSHDSPEFDGRIMHFQHTPPPPPSVAAALRHGRALANGVHDSDEDEAPGEGEEEAGDEHAGASKAPARKGRGVKAAGKAAAGRAAGRGGKAAAAAESPKAASSKARTPGQQFAQMQADEPAQPAESPSAARAGRVRSAAKAAAATPVANGAHAVLHAATAQQEAAAGAAAKQHAPHAKWRAWAPTAAAVGVAMAALAVLVCGTPQLLTAVNHRSATVSRFLPGPLAQLAVMGHSFGLASGSSRARASFLATQRAAAAVGPGAVVLYEAYVSDSEQAGDSEGSWQKAALRYCLGSTQVRTRGGFWRQLRGARGLCQMRLQAQMAAAAAAGATSSGGDDLEVEHWLMVLADKLVQGSSSLEGLLDGAVQQHDFVTVSRAAYTPGPKAWRLDAANTAPVIEGQHRSSAMLRSWAEVYTAVPGDDGWLVDVLESWARRLSGPWVLAALLLAVAARHMLLPGGLVHECQKSML